MDRRLTQLAKLKTECLHQVPGINYPINNQPNSQVMTDDWRIFVFSSFSLKKKMKLLCTTFCLFFWTNGAGVSAAVRLDFTFICWKENKQYWHSSSNRKLATTHEYNGGDHSTHGHTTSIIYWGGPKRCQVTGHQARRKTCAVNDVVGQNMYVSQGKVAVSQGLKTLSSSIFRMTGTDATDAYLTGGIDRPAARGTRVTAAATITSTTT